MAKFASFYVYNLLSYLERRGKKNIIFSYCHFLSQLHSRSLILDTVLECFSQHDDQSSVHILRTELNMYSIYTDARRAVDKCDEGIICTA